MIDPRIVAEFNARAPFKLEDAQVLVLAKVGSHSHGTFVPATDPNAIDDVDYMGIVVPPPSYTFGIRNWEHLAFKVDELDVVFHSFAKFVGLLAKCNPNVLGMLWMRPEFYVDQAPIWRQFLAGRRYFSSKKAYGPFLAYARAQLHKMTSFDLQTQNSYDRALQLIEAAGWTREAVVEKKHLDMPNLEAIVNLLYEVTPSEIESATVLNPNTALRIPATLKVTVLRDLEMARLEVIRIHAKHFQGYMGDKRKGLVRKHGYDTKNAAHLIRLTRMCIEFLKDGALDVFRTYDAETLKQIKGGAWTLEQVKTAAEELFLRADQAYKDSPLPEEPDWDAIDKLVIDTHLEAYDLIDAESQFPNHFTAFGS